ncbi:hypothetical protein JXA47_02890 [Candidatus Sumerlaeota bacterium]|nr:hypothetical protein [Candidatus Sumerlaeota bacterium]
MGRQIGIIIALLAAAAVAVWLFTGGERESPAPEEEPTALEESLIPEPTPESEESPTHLSYPVPSQATAEEATVSQPSVASAPQSASETDEEPPPERHTRVWGMVTDEDDQPVAEAVVTAIDSYHGLGTALAATQTNFEGIYEFLDIHRLTPGQGNEIEIAVFAEAPGYSMGVGDDELERDETEVRIDVELPPGGPGIDGLVRWENGEPVAFAEIFGFVSQTETLSRAVADAQGQFHLRGLPMEEFGALVRPPGGLWHIVEEEIDPNEGPVELVLTPDIGVITGQVVGAISRTPHPGSVVFLGDQFNGMRSRSATADSEGRFRFEGLPLCRWFVHSGEGMGEGADVAHLTSEHPEQEVTVRFPESFTVVGTVVDQETDEPVPDLGLTVRSSPNGDETPTQTDGSGQFEVPLLLAPSDPTRAMVIFSLPDPPWVFERGTREIAEHLDLTAEELPIVRLEVIQGWPLEILAQDSDGNPLAGAELRLVSGVEIPMDLGRTDAEGRLAAVRSEQMVECQVLGSHPDWPLLSSPPVSQRETSTVVQPSPTVDLEILVLDPDGAPAPGAHVQVTGITGELVAIDPRGLDHHYRRSTDTGTTDESGNVVFEGRPRTQHFLYASLSADPEVGGPGVESGIRVLLAEAHDQVDLSHATTATAQVTLRLQPVEGVTVTGQVLDSQGSPLPNADVRWNVINEFGTGRGGVFTPPMSEPPDAVADAQGRFTLTGTYAQSRMGFSVSRMGYLTWPQTPAIRDGEFYEIQMVPEITLQGRTTINDAGCAFYLFLPATVEEGEGWMARATKYPHETPIITDGVMRWTLPRIDPVEFSYPSPAWLLAITSDGRQATANLALGSGPAQVIDLGALNLAPAHSLEGRILSAAGDPMTDASALWESREVRPPDGWDDHFAWIGGTDGSGHFELRGLPPGPTRVLVYVGRANVGRALRQVFEVDIPTGGPIDLVLDPLEWATLTMRVLDAEGAPITGAQTYVRVVHGGRQQSGPVHTDHRGEAVHPELVPGSNRLTLVMVHQGTAFNLSFERNLEAGEQAEVIDLSTWPVLRGRVTRGGETAANVALSLYEHGQPNNPDRVSLSTDEGGGFEVTLIPGSWDIYTDSGQPRATVEVPGDEFVEIDLLN